MLGARLNQEVDVAVRPDLAARGGPEHAHILRAVLPRDPQNLLSVVFDYP